MYNIIKDNDAMVGIDLIAALTLITATVIMAIQIMPNLAHDNISQEDKSDRIMRYMAATRASDSLVQDDGGDWDANLRAGKYLNITKIGFVYVGNESGKSELMLKVLNETKITELMGPGYPDNGTGTILYWWEFPDSTTPQEARSNVTRALGLTGYNFYMQLHPVGLNDSQFNSIPLKMNLINRSKVPINNDTAVAIDRYVYIKDIKDDSCEAGYLCYWNATVGNNITVHYRLNLWVW